MNQTINQWVQLIICELAYGAIVLLLGAIIMKFLGIIEDDTMSDPDPKACPDLKEVLVIPGPCLLSTVVHRYVCRCNQCVRSMLLDYVNGQPMRPEERQLVEDAMRRVAGG